MSVVVKGMKMPENCWECIQSGFRTAIGCTEWTKISAGRCETERAYSCPITALPDTHGRLVDADALRESVLKWLPHDPCGVEENEHPYETDICVSMLMEIEDAPTIVDLEGENANHN